MAIRNSEFPIVSFFGQFVQLGPFVSHGQHIRRKKKEKYERRKINWFPFLYGDFVFLVIRFSSFSFFMLIKWSMRHGKFIFHGTTECSEESKCYTMVKIATFFNWFALRNQTQIDSCEASKSPQLHSNSPLITYSVWTTWWRIQSSIHHHLNGKEFSRQNTSTSGRLSRGNYFNSMLDVDLEDDSTRSFFTCTLQWTDDGR